MAEPLVALFVAGTPVQQGSKSIDTRGPKPRMFDQNGKQLAPWRRTVRDAARAVWRDQGRSPIGEPVQATVTFVFATVPSQPDRHWHPEVPDIDKLERALYDGLVDGALLLDDRFVVKHLVSKRYAEHGEEPGVSVSIDSLADHEALARARRQRDRIRR